MYRIVATSFLALLCGPCLAEPPTVSSVERLLVVSGSKKTLEGTYSALAQLLRQGVRLRVEERKLSVEQQQRLPEILEKVEASVRKEFDWEVMKVPIIQVNRENLTQQEVDAAIAFYTSPLGRSIVAKTPAMMQKSMLLSQQQMRDAMPRLDAEMERIILESTAPVKEK